MQALRHLRPRSLAARLVLTVVTLVLLVTVLVGAVTTLAARAYLTDQLDDEVRASLQREQGALLLAEPGHDPDRDLGHVTGPPGSADVDHGGDGGRVGPGELGDQRGQRVGTLRAIWIEGGDATGDVIVQESGGATSRPTLSEDALDDLDDAPADGDARTVDVGDLGSYRVAVVAVAGDKIAVGLPTEDVDDVLRTLVAWVSVLTGVGAVIAVGGGLALVRRQLRPLLEVAATAHHVAETPLAQGEISLDLRVPDRLTDERTEVGQVGAALNTMLDHVESSLSARHRSEQHVRRFVADASHELRTPLATIAGYAELARRRPEDEVALRTALAKVDEESQRMTTLVEDLLLLARLDSGRPLERQPVDLTRLLLEAVADARVLAPGHDWRLDLPNRPVEVPGDEQRLHQVLTNLLSNARKYTPAGTTVTVIARHDGFAVRDNGPGFPPQIAGVAFERFTRADTARHRQGGVGLGLALVDAIVTAHGGRVTLRSAPGDTRITVSLPVPETAPALAV